MADKPAKPRDVLDFSGAMDYAKPAATAVKPVVPVVKPVDLPPVPRPDRPESDEQAAPDAMDNVLGSIVSFMDNVVPDDLGGMVTGTSGWLARVPGYRVTLGTVASGALTGGAAVTNAMIWGSEQMDRVGAWGMSVLPGGMDTLTWDQSYQVSTMQASMTNAGIALRGSLEDGDLSLLDIGSIFLQSGIGGGVNAIWNPEVVAADGFDVLDPEDKAAAFEDDPVGKFISGTGDAIWDVLGDPTIVGGKATSVLRTGTKMGKFGGLSNQALRTREQVRHFGDRVDLGVEYAASSGKSGKWTPEIESVYDLISKRPDQLDRNPFVRSSSRPDAVKQLAGMVGEDDLATGAALVKAMAGDAAGWVSLRERSVPLYDQLSRTMGVDPLELLPGSKALSPDQVAYASRLVEEAAKIPFGRAADGYSDALKVTKESASIEKAAVDAAGTLAGGQLITRGGNRVSASMTHMANAYRKGASGKQFGVIHDGPLLTVDAPTFSKSQWVADTLEFTAGSRAVRALRWVGQGSPSGVVHLKGGDGNTALAEVTAFLRKSRMSGDEANAHYTAFTRATTPEAKRNALLAMERSEVESIAREHGVSSQVAMTMYEDYVRTRHRHLLTMRQPKTGFAVDDAGDLITTPGLYTDLDEAFPLLDQAVFNRVTRQNKKWLQLVEDSVLIADTVNTWWKLSVLLRLGYTQRNVTEGALRSVAAMGFAAANPQSFTRLPANIVYYTKGRTLRRSLKQQDRAMMTAYDNLTVARGEFLDSVKAAHYEEFLAARDEAERLGNMISSLQKIASPTKKQQDELERLVRKHEKATAKADRLKTDFVDPGTPNMQGMQAKYQRILDDIDAQSQEILATAERLKGVAGKRVKSGRDSNVQADGAVLRGAFEGSEGRIAALLASADRTARMTFDNSFEARRAAQEASQAYRAMDPRMMRVGDAQTYWDEYAIRLNQRWANDPIVKTWLARADDAGTPLADTKAWLMSKAGSDYRASLSVGERRLQNKAGLADEAAVDEYLTELWRQYSKEIPADTPLRSMLRDGTVTPAEAAAAFGRKTPPAIPVRELGETTGNIFQRAHGAARAGANKIMQALGSFPETTLVRHPFYNAVYKQRQGELYRLAKDQGQDISSATVKTRINKAAHADALQSTKTTMYTIERLSNAATMLRWVAPFFPAFENALRVWGRLVYTNPAVLGYGNLLWNVPNSLGWVYDKDGNKVEHSNMFRDEGHVVILPQQLQEFFIETLPDVPFVNPEAMIATRQAGYNVILPGAEFWWPGVGPMAQTAVALVLRGRPEWTDIARSLISEEMFSQIVPGGDPNTGILEIWASTFFKRVHSKVFKGTSEDGAYLTLMNTMVEDAYIQAQIEDRTLTKADMQKIKEKTDNFYEFMIRSAAMDFTSSSRYQSPYALQRNEWNKLLDDQSLSWDEKVKVFVDKFTTDFVDGNDYLAVTRSGSANSYGIQPTLSAWQKINSNPELVAELRAIDPALVGMFANMANFDDPFSYSVYSELGSLTFAGDGKPVRSQLTPEMLQRNNEIQDGWREWNLIVDTLNSEANKGGKKTYKSFDGLEAIADREMAKLIERYPAWGQEKVAFEEKFPTFIVGARVLVQNATLVGESPTMKVLAEYLYLRDTIAYKRRSTDDDDKKAKLNELAYEYVEELRNKDIGFADLYDRYLARDDFRVI